MHDSVTINGEKSHNLWIWEGNLDVMPGSDINDTCADLCALATATGEAQSVEFNGVEIAAVPGADPDDLRRWWSSEMDRKHDEWLASDERKALVAEAERKEAERATKLSEMEAKTPAEPTWSNPADWQKCVDANQDGYGGACVSYTLRWARLMEGAINDGAKLEDAASNLSHLADSEGITGFMYGCAVSMLSRCWVHGEDLRRWHNKSTQIGTEGEKANDGGGVLNPALLTIG